MAIDIVLIGLVVVGFIVGFFRGVIRSLLAVAAWGVCFLFAAYLRAPLGDWLAHSATFSPFYADMVSFAVIFFGLFGALILVVVLSRAPTEWSRHAVIDDLLGGILGIVVVLFVVAAVIVMLDSYYAVENPPVSVDIGWPADLHRAFAGSAIAGFVGDAVVHFLGFVLGPLLPPDVHAVMV
jgi:uncharacterized membrane protein required for colicin V production